MSRGSRSGNLKGLLLFALLLLSRQNIAGGSWELPPLPPADEYGNILISRTSGDNKIKPATFSHWIHRRKFTCRVCHFELEFNFKVNTTEITEGANRAGKYCGTSGCHDGKASFGHKEPECEKCHNGNRSYKKERFAELSKLPTARFGNKIDWGKAVGQWRISPVKYLFTKPDKDVSFREEVRLESEWNGIPPSIFPHRTHSWLLDCSNCHPEPFNIKKKTTRNFSMLANLSGEFCGVCHLTVAFPMHDCKRCHPGMLDE
jgi:c(7)-type cytochrome triheme protein